MAKHPKGRSRRFNLRRVRVSPELPLLTTASDTAVKTVLTAASVSTYRAVSLKATWSITDLTANDGLITVGLAFSDYSVAEIKECLEVAGSISPLNKIAQEQANRLVRIVGSMNEVRETLNDGQPITTKLNWLIPIGGSVEIFAYNQSTGALTTGAIINVDGDLWVKDST